MLNVSEDEEEAALGLLDETGDTNTEANQGQLKGMSNGHLNLSLSFFTAQRRSYDTKIILSAVWLVILRFSIFAC